MMNQKSHTAEDMFFAMLDCAKVYRDFTQHGKIEDIPDKDTDKLMTYAVYLNELNKRTIDETGEEL